VGLRWVRGTGKKYFRHGMSYLGEYGRSAVLTSSELEEIVRLNTTALEYIIGRVTDIEQCVKRIEAKLNEGQNDVGQDAKV